MCSMNEIKAVESLISNKCDICLVAKTEIVFCRIAGYILFLEHKTIVYPMMFSGVIIYVEVVVLSHKFTMFITQFIAYIVSSTNLKIPKLRSHKK